ncbi:MAG: cytochrome c3 family protein [Desulfuromonas sp.]|nr:cytochrome c3 family protein [Desulfuromonas sp.]
MNYCRTSIICGISIIALVLFVIAVQAASGDYTASAHGNSSYGVLRTSMTPYARGNCAHCHEQHTSVAGNEPAPVSGSSDCYLLFANSGPTMAPYAQSDSICFACHGGLSTMQNEVIGNNNYSATFAGATVESDNIMTAFNQSSYHNLHDIKKYIVGDSGTKSFANFPAGSNPCCGCHNIHIARANKRDPGNPVSTALSKPSDHGNLFGNDTPAERMSDTTYNANYQPPYFIGSSNLEPDGLSSDRATQAEKTPDYDEFCTDCHNSTNTIYSTTLARNLRTIDWDNEKHGKGDAEGSISVDAPFTSGSGSMGYVLACTDCHEPHGSSNVFLIRNGVNGAQLSGNISAEISTDWRYLCARCHDDDNENIHHSSADKPYTQYQCKKCHSNYPTSALLRCSNCHYHGSWVNDPSNSLDQTPDDDPTTRKTF